MDKLLNYFDKYFKRDEIKVIVECGSHKCEDTLELALTFPNAEVMTFECNPATIPICREKAEYNSRIHLIEKALTDHTGEVTFYPMNKEKTRTTWEDGNQGASSMFKASGKYPIETYVQDEITVPCVSLKDLFIQPDLMWLDAQGAELLILKGTDLSKTKFIRCEVEFLEQYTGQPLYPEIKEYLGSQGFTFIGFSDEWEWFADAYFYKNV